MMVFDSLRRKFLANVLGEYPASSTAVSTRLRVETETFSGFINARDTVAVETPASWATSFIVAIN